MNILTAQARSLVTLFFLRCRPVGGPCSREPFEAPVNLGTWEPDTIGTLSSYGAKAVSEVLVPPPLQNQLNCIPRTKYLRGILWFSRRYAASAAAAASASADTSSFSP